MYQPVFRANRPEVRTPYPYRGSKSAAIANPSDLFAVNLSRRGAADYVDLSVQVDSCIFYLELIRKVDVVACVHPHIRK